MKQQKQFWILTALTAVVTLFIFGNSLQGSEVSNGATDSVLGFLAPLLSALESLFGKADWFYILRKAAHMAEFCALAVVVRCLSHTVAAKLQRPLAAHAVLYVVAVALTDEFIQGFSDRSSEVTDVLIDCTGALIGFAIVELIRLWRRKRKRKVEE